MKIEATRQYRTVSAKYPVVLYAHNEGDCWHGAYILPNGHRRMAVWDEKGEHVGGMNTKKDWGLDLEEIPEFKEVTKYVNVYEDGGLGALRNTPKECVSSKPVFAIAEVKIKVQRGENIPKT